MDYCRANDQAPAAEYPKLGERGGSLLWGLRAKDLGFVVIREVSGGIHTQWVVALVLKEEA